MTPPQDEDALLRSVALETARSIRAARQRAEEELVRTKEALRQSQERLTAALSAAGTSTFRWDIASDLVEWDGNIASQFGLASSNRPGALPAFLAAVHQDDRAHVRAAFDACAAGAADIEAEFRVVQPDGRVRWIGMKGRTFSGEGPAPRYVTGACADVTSRRRAEEALREETRTLELLNRTGQMLASQLDLQTVLQAVTDAATELSGAEFGAFFYNTTEPAGDSYLLYTLSGAPREAFEGFGQPRATKLFGPTFRGGATIRSGNVRKDPRYGSMAPHYGMPQGHLPVCSYLAVPVRSRSGEVIGGLFFGHSTEDVFSERTERLISGIAAQAGIAVDNARLYEAAQKAAAERQVLLESERAARAVAERLSKVKDEFLATLSHELRTPLNAILGWSQILRTGPYDRADLLKGLATIERNARAQAQLIEDLLDMSRITSGRLRLEVQAVLPGAVIEAAIESVRPAADARGIRVDRQIDPTAGPVSADPARLQQIIWNLLSNAIKFTPRGGHVQVALRRANASIEIAVADTGVGIEPELIPYLFERFRQADASITRRYGGLGLGLSIVKSLVELHGGSVAVESAGTDQGTTVRVHLPITADQGMRDWGIAE